MQVSITAAIIISIVSLIIGGMIGAWVVSWEKKDASFHYIIGKLNELQFLITNLNSKQMATLTDLQNKIAALTAAVQAEDTVIGSAVTLLQGLTTHIGELSQQLADAIANEDPAAIQAVADALDATTTDVTAKTTDLANAVEANTPH